MSHKIEGNNKLVIEFDRNSKEKSTSGKTFLLASSHGYQNAQLQARIIVEAYLEGKIQHIPKGAETTERYWDCECKENYIHPKTQTECSVCGAVVEEQPDSRTNEVLLRGLPL